MTLYQIVGILKQIALTQPNVKSATDGSIYEVMDATNSVKYDVVHLSQTKHITDEETDTYGFNIFYVSRLEDSLEDNRLQIQSIGKEVLDNILRTFCENWGIDYPEIIFYPYTQKFADLCAGCYCRVELEVPKEIICADDFTAEVVPGSGIKLQDMGITITQNGLTVVTPSAEYDGIGEIRIETDVPQSTADLQYKEVEYTENGEYVVRPDQDYDGLTEVAVSVDVPDRYEEGYDDGKEDGIAEQKAKLSTTSVTENGTYTRADGYSAITVDVPQGQGYEEGYEDGVADQKAKLSGITITENGDYNREDGYSAITVNVPSDYQDGYEDGVADQKAKLVSTAVTENGTYTREDGYSAITVNVDDRYDEGYADGYAAGASACSGYFITALTLNVDSAINNYGTATTTYSPVTAITDIYYTSSDPSIATIDSGTGEITVLSSGTVTICAQDSITRLQDCKEITVIYDDTDYLTFEILTGGTIKANDRNIYHKLNDGEWISGTSFNVSEGDIVKFRIIGEETTGFGLFTGTTAHFNVSGNAATICTHPENHLFAYMFRETNVVSAKYLVLPVTSKVSQYQRMFLDCVHLIEAPELPATNLPGGYYEGMFWGCTSLETAPVLPAKNVPNTCYANMFRGCRSLNYVKCLATSLAGDCTSAWLSGVSSSGTFVKDPNMSDWEIGSTSGIPSGWTITDNT